MQVRALIVLGPALSSHEGHEADGSQRLPAVAFAAVRSSDADQLLTGEGGTDGDDHPPPRSQLVLQRRRNIVGTSGGDDDGIEGGVLLPPEGAVTHRDIDVLVSESPEAFFRRLGRETLRLEDEFNRAAGFSVADDELPSARSPGPISAASAIMATMKGCEMVWPSSIGSGRSL